MKKQTAPQNPQEPGQKQPTKQPGQPGRVPTPGQGGKNNPNAPKY